MNTVDKPSPSYYMEKAIKKYNPNEIFVGFSGGGDSLLCADIITNLYPEAKIFHANTGIGLEKTREFVREYCEERGWDLVEIRAKEDCGQDYEKMVLEYGFPGPAMHGRMYQRLKERPVRKLHKRYKGKRGGKILIATGIRHDESIIRAGYKNSIIDEIGGVVWVNPVYWFSAQDKHDYLQKNNIKTNPVSDVIGMSGECLCGAYAHKGELDLIRLVEPETADYIEELQDRVYNAGWKWPWESKPSKALILEKNGQGNLFEPMCVGCGKRNEKFNENNEL